MANYVKLLLFEFEKCLIVQILKHYVLFEWNVNMITGQSLKDCWLLINI